MDFQDVNIKCVTCGREFLFTAREQEFFAGKGFKEPRHCRECRQRRKLEREQAYAEATGRVYRPGRDMFKVTCARCQRETFVPFKPITGKPVLCKDCFIAQRYGAEPKPAGLEQVESATPEPQPPGEERPSAASEAIPEEGPEIDLESVTSAPAEVEPGAAAPTLQPDTTELQEAPASQETESTEKDEEAAEPQETPDEMDADAEKTEQKAELPAEQTGKTEGTEEEQEPPTEQTEEARESEEQRETPAEQTEEAREGEKQQEPPAEQTEEAREGEEQRETPAESKVKTEEDETTASGS